MKRVVVDVVVVQLVLRVEELLEEVEVRLVELVLLVEVEMVTVELLQSPGLLVDSLKLCFSSRKGR